MVRRFVPIHPLIPAPKRLSATDHTPFPQRQHDQPTNQCPLCRALRTQLGHRVRSEKCQARYARLGLILVAEKDGPTMFARMGMMQAINPHKLKEFDRKQKSPH
jgi:hypothetical protein